ncbi:hypothetical protein BJV78DRAFT_1283454 [Lactifluus subvellereus]|nr:hypothetical protein BJV78DRAFT_1283454 [Lactifluus subvellereus]
MFKLKWTTLASLFYYSFSLPTSVKASIASSSPTSFPSEVSSTGTFKYSQPIQPRLVVQKIDFGLTSFGELFVLLAFIFSFDNKILFLGSHFLIIGPQNKHYLFLRM